jgi:DNA mismatch repair protein MutS2
LLDDSEEIRATDTETAGTAGAGPGAAEPPGALGGFSLSVSLLEFDQIRQQLAAYTRTVMGREAALSLAPSPDLLEVAGRQQETTEARRFLDQGGSLEFGPGIDFREYVQRALLGGLLRGEELYAIRGLAAAARYDRRSLPRHEEFPLLAGVADNLPDLAALEQAAGAAISPAGEVLDTASPALRQLRQESRSAHQRLNGVMERNLRRLQRQELVQEPIITQRNGRMVLLIKAEMRSQVPGIVHDVSDSGATVFVEPMPAIDPGNRWRELRLAEEREEERVLRHLSGLVGQAGQDLLLTLDLLARLDLAMARGRYSAATRSTAPSVSDAAGQVRLLRIVRGRHPLLSGAAVPISLELGGERTVMLITGPNAGGKTVTLKTVGLLALMAQAGLHVPADEAQFPRFDGIYADIGDQQSIEQSLSTFSSHIRNLLSIMERSTGDSLVLVDELGTSTDPEEGSALGKAILGYFQRRGALLVATTHHRGVARYVQEQPGMINASVDLHPQTLDPTYQVTLGLPGRSYALTIAARLGLPPELIEPARGSLSPEERASEDLLRELQEERVLVDNLRQAAEAALLQAKERQAELEARLDTVETSKVELVEEARQELQSRIGGLLARLQRAERALDQPPERAPDQPAGRKVLEEERAQLLEARRQVASPRWEPIKVRRVLWYERLKGGDRVFVRGIARPVEVITPPDEEGLVEVLLGTMRSKIPVYQLERLAEGHQPAAQHGVFFSRPARRNVAAEIDLRGLRVDEAVGRVDGWLNDAAIDGVSPLRIIHGKGTGALRSAVRDYLDGHPLVVSARYDEGPAGDGVTVVELK